MTAITVFASAVFMAICFGLAFFHAKKTGQITLIDWCLLAVGGVYGGGWALVAMATLNGLVPVWEDWILPNQDLWPLHTAHASLAVGGLVVGWIALRPNIQRTAQMTRPLISVAWYVALFWALLLLAIASYALYSSAYGGPLGIHDYASQIRQSMFEIENEWSFLRPFAHLTSISALGFFGILMSRKQLTAASAGIALLGFSTAVTMSIHLLGIGGMVNMALFWLAFGVALLIHLRTPPMIFVSVGAVVLCSAVVAAALVRVTVSGTAEASLIGQVAKELSFPFVAYFAWQEGGAIPYRWFVDYFALPVFLAPSSLWSGWIEPITRVNTALVHGSPKGENGVTSGMPTDLVVVGLLQAPLIGVPAVGFIVGGLLRILHRVIDALPHAGLRASFMSYAALYVACKSSFYAQPDGLVSGNFSFLVALGALFIVPSIARLSTS